MAGLSEDEINRGRSTLAIEAKASIFLRPVKKISSFEIASSTQVISLAYFSLFIET